MRRSIAGEPSDISDIGTRPLRTAGACVTCLDFSPFANDLFLVGQLDGGCRLHQLDRPTPLLSWPFIVPPKADTNVSTARCGLRPTSMATDLKWSPQRPSIFFLLHSNGDLYTFDLARDDTAPVHSYAMSWQFDARAYESLPKLAISCGFTPANKFLVVSFGDAIFMRPLSESACKQRDGELNTLRAKFAKAIAL